MCHSKSSQIQRDSLEKFPFKWDKALIIVNCNRGRNVIGSSSCLVLCVMDFVNENTLWLSSHLKLTCMQFFYLGVLWDHYLDIERERSIIFVIICRTIQFSINVSNRNWELWKFQYFNEPNLVSLNSTTWFNHFNI